MTKCGPGRLDPFGHSDFVIGHSIVIRASTFVILIVALASRGRAYDFSILAEDVLLAIGVLGQPISKTRTPDP